jgi:hypothetical protein
MNRGMNQNDVRPYGAKTLGSTPPAVARAVVGNQEHVTCRSVRLLSHDLPNQAMESGNAVPPLAAAEQSGPMRIPCGEIVQGTRTHVFVLNVDRAPRRRRQRGMYPSPGLDAGLLVDAEHVILRPSTAPFQRRW